MGLNRIPPPAAGSVGGWIDIVILLLTVMAVAPLLWRGAAIGRRSKPWARTIIVAGALATLAGLGTMYPVGLADLHHAGGWNHLVLVPPLLLVVGPVAVSAAAASLKNTEFEFVYLDVIATVIVPVGLTIAVVLVQGSYWYPTNHTSVLTIETTYPIALALAVVLTVVRAIRRRRFTSA